MGKLIFCSQQMWYAEQCVQKKACLPGWCLWLSRNYISGLHQSDKIHLRLGLFQTLCTSLAVTISRNHTAIKYISTLRQYHKSVPPRNSIDYSMSMMWITLNPHLKGADTPYPVRIALSLTSGVAQRKFLGLQHTGRKGNHLGCRNDNCQRSWSHLWQSRSVSGIVEHWGVSPLLINLKINKVWYNQMCKERIGTFSKCNQQIRG